MTKNNTILLIILGVIFANLTGIKIYQLNTAGSKKNTMPIVVYAVLPHPYFYGVAKGAEKFSNDSGIPVRVAMGQEGTQSNVNSNIESLFTMGYQSFSIYPVDPAGSKGLFKRLNDAGIDAVAYGAQPAAGTVAPFSVATDTHQAATMAAEELCRLLKYKGNILNVLESMTDANTPIRKAAIEAVVAKYPGIKIVQTIGDMESEQKALEKIESALVARGNEVDGIICTGYTTTVATSVLLSKHNSKKDARRIAFVGLDTDKRVLEAIKDGKIDATFAQNPFGHGYITCSILNLLNKGWKPKKDYQFIDSGVVLVNKDNVDTFNEDVKKTTLKIVGKLKTDYLTAP